MGKYSIANRGAHFLTQVLFSLLTPALLLPGLARLRITRSCVLFCFGKLYGNRYQGIINSFQEAYASPITWALSRVQELGGTDISRVVDCGAGTGFATQKALEFFPQAGFIVCDRLESMLHQAQENLQGQTSTIQYLQADTFALPLADASVDLVLVQNSIPCFDELVRICRPGGAIVYVDTSAGWVASLARRLVQRQKTWQAVIGKRIDLGLAIVAFPGSGTHETLKPKKNACPGKHSAHT